MSTYFHDDRMSLTAIVTGLKHRNKVHEMDAADRCYENERYAECASTCYEVLRADPSEAIQGRCHMYLAMEGVGPEEAAGRAYHAGMALQMWQAVIERTGVSRYPIDRAELQVAFAQQLLESAEAIMREEHTNTPLRSDEANGVEGSDVEMYDD